MIHMGFDMKICEKNVKIITNTSTSNVKYSGIDESTEDTKCSN